MTHTPGPWFWEDDSRTRRQFQIYAYHGIRRHIATVNHLPEAVLQARNPREAEANASILAAAPDLANVLTQAIAALERVRPQARGALVTQDIDSAIKDGRAALKRAGKSF